MKPLSQEENEIVGQWLSFNGVITPNEECKRIEWLISSQLILVGEDATGWERLYKNPENGQYWLLSYPQSNLHGGGPPRLKVIEASETTKFQISQRT